MNRLRYPVGASLPDAGLVWWDDQGELIQFASGYTFSVVVKNDDVTLFTKATGVSGANESPNVRIAWDATTELSVLAEGLYQAFCVATRSSDSKKRVMPFEIEIVGH